ncbi:MAG: hypothetical protein N2Z59_04995 [Alteraurantiacibacter sp.]|nr:hypothetical protein [Alteraurantiacibacter sp.]
MSADHILSSRKKLPWWARIALWGMAGGLFGYAMARYLEPAGALPDGSALIAGLVALLYAVPGIIVVTGCLVPRAGIAWRMFADREAWQDEHRLTLRSGLGCLLIAAFLLALVAARPLGLMAAEAALAIAAVTGLASTWVTWRTWTLMDELWRRVSAEATVVAFYLVLVPGVAWSLLAHLQLAPALAPLDWISLILAASFAASVIATARRGMLEDRL